MNNITQEASDMGGDGGGGAAVADSAPAPEAAQSTPDVYGTTESSPATGSPEGSTSLLGQLYDSQGELTGDFNQTLTNYEMGDYANLIGKYKSFDGLVKGFKNAEGLLGKKAMNPDAVVVPPAGATDEEMAAYRSAIGVPDSPTAYDIQPENMPEGLEWSNDLAETWQSTFHDLGISQDQATALAQAYSDITGTQLEAAQLSLNSNQEAQMAQQQQEMKATWGNDYDSNMKMAVDVASVVGFDFDNADDMAALRHPKVLNMLVEKGSSIKEGTMPRGGEPAASGKSLDDVTKEIYMRNHGNMATAPPHEQARYNEAMKLKARQYSQ